jgi:hypothetical protein
MHDQAANLAECACKMRSSGRSMCQKGNQNASKGSACWRWVKTTGGEGLIRERLAAGNQQYNKGSRTERPTFAH